MSYSEERARYGTTDEGAYAPGLILAKKTFGDGLTQWRAMRPATLPDGRTVEGRAMLRKKGAKEEPTREEVETARREGRKPQTWEYDAWRVVLCARRDDPRAAPRFFACDYRTGVGQRVEPRRVSIGGVPFFGDNPKRVRCRPYGMTNEDRAIIAAAAPTAPEVSDVLGNYLQDAAGTDGETFAGWARNYGYSDDSIRARNVFDSCRDVAALLPGFLGVPLHDFGTVAEFIENEQCERGRAERAATEKGGAS